jgi:hypothetical protein
MFSFQDKLKEEIISKKPKKKDSDNVQRETKFSIDDEIPIQFFKNTKFLPYFINYVKQETVTIDIQIEKADSNNDESSFGYTVKLTGTKQQNRLVRSFMKHLLDSIKTKIYNQNQVPNWSFKLKSVDIIRNILNNESHLFTVCQLFDRRLEVSYFEDQKFNSSGNLIEINDIIQNQIVQEDVHWSSVENRHRMEFINFNTRQILSKYQVCVTEQFEEEFEQILNQYKQDYPLVSVDLYNKNRLNTKRMVEIFGYRKLVDEVLQIFKDLFDKHRLRKFRFSQISSTEVRLHFLYIDE